MMQDAEDVVLSVCCTRCMMTLCMLYSVLSLDHGMPK